MYWTKFVHWGLSKTNQTKSIDQIYQAESTKRIYKIKSTKQNICSVKNQIYWTKWNLKKSIVYSYIVNFSLRKS